MWPPLAGRPWADEPQASPSGLFLFPQQTQNDECCRHHSSRWDADFLFSLMWQEIPQREKGNRGVRVELSPGSGSASHGSWLVAGPSFRATQVSADLCLPSGIPPLPFSRGLGPGPWSTGLGHLSGRQSPARPVAACHPVSQGPGLGCHQERLCHRACIGALILLKEVGGQIFVGQSSTGDDNVETCFLSAPACSLGPSAQARRVVARVL